MLPHLQPTIRSSVFCIGLLLIFYVSIIAAAVEQLRYDKELSKDVTSLLDTLLREDKYDKRIRPNFGSEPVNVDVNMYIKNLGPVSETDEVITIDCYFRQRWKENRLKFNITGIEELSLNWLFLSKIWVPDTYFINGQTSKLHQITVPNKLTIKSSCKMFLKKFPLDVQRCNLEVGSYGYNSADVHYNWVADNPIGIEEGVHLAQYDLVDTITRQETRSLSAQGDISVIMVQFVLARHKGYFILQIFMPACLIVLSSWVTFWIDPSAVPARVSLGVTTVLSMTTLGFGGRAQLPRTSYATALDWFVIICFAFVFASMVEYATINFMEKMLKDITTKAKTKKRTEITKPKPRPSLEIETTEEVPAPTSLVSLTRLFQSYKERFIYWYHRQMHDPWKQVGAPVSKFSKVDIYARKIFPISFLIINIIYWVAFLYYEKDEYAA